MKLKMIKPAKLDVKKCLEILRKPLDTKVGLVKLKIPKNLPDIYYSLSKVIDGKAEPMRGHFGVVSFYPRFSDINGGLELGHSLRTDNRALWYVTSTLREITDKGSYVLMTTSSGTIYRIEPYEMKKSEFLKARGLK